MKKKIPIFIVEELIFILGKRSELLKDEYPPLSAEQE